MFHGTLTRTSKRDPSFNHAISQDGDRFVATALLVINGPQKDIDRCLEGSGQA